MKKDQIKKGGIYIANVNGRTRRVRVDDIKTFSFGLRKTTSYEITNLETGRETSFRSAQKFIREAGTEKQEADRIYRKAAAETVKHNEQEAIKRQQEGVHSDPVLPLPEDRKPQSGLGKFMVEETKADGTPVQEGEQDRPFQPPRSSTLGAASIRPSGSVRSPANEKSSSTTDAAAATGASLEFVSVYEKRGDEQRSDPTPDSMPSSIKPSGMTASGSSPTVAPSTNLEPSIASRSISSPVPNLVGPLTVGMLMAVIDMYNELRDYPRPMEKEPLETKRAWEATMRSGKRVAEWAAEKIIETTAKRKIAGAAG